MALLKFKRSAVPAKVPSIGDLALGELAINTFDGKMYTKKNNGTESIIEIGGAGGGGTVTSVAASGGTTGLTFSGSPITNSGTLTLGGTLAVANGGTGATTLTSGYVLKGNGTSAVSASVLYDDGTNTGIGTTSPSALFHISRNGGGDIGALVSQTNSGNGTTARYRATHGSGAAFNLQAGNGQVDLKVTSNHHLTFGTNDIERFRVGASGQFGIGGATYGSAGQVLTSGGASAAPTWTTPTTGTVTSVGGTGTVSGLTLSGTVTTSGNLTLGGTLAVTPSNFASQTANTILAAPNGTAGVPTFRAIVAADIPTLNQNTTGNAATATTLQTARTINGVSFNGSANITVADSTKLPLAGGTMSGAITFAAGQTWPTFNQNTTGTAANVTGTVAIANGGTGSTTAGAALTALGAYPATNPNGYTNNTGTVTGVTGTAPIVSSGGTAPAISISAATTSAAGSMSATDKTKLDGIAANANNYVLPKATATALGGVEVFDATVQTVAANAVTATASRTYGVQLNAADQMVVNVPWVDTVNAGTVTSVSGTGTVSGLTLTGSVTTSGSLTLGGTLSLTSGNVTTALGYTPYNATNPSGYITGSGSITGSAGSLTGFTNSASANPISGPDNLTNNGLAYVTGMSLLGQTDGALYAQAYSASWIHQIYGDYRTGQIALRGKNNGAWQAWRINLDSGNYTSYSPSLTGSGASGTWGISITGNAATVTNGLYTSGDQTTITGTKRFYSPNNTQINTVTAGDRGLSVFQETGSADAYMTFHVSTDYAAYFGLGGAENDLVYGGWSAGATRHRILHSGNYTSWAYPATNPSGYTSNAGTVTSVATGTGLTGGPITSSGTIALANTAVTAGSYTNANITVDAQGRLTAASSGSGGSTAVSYPQNIQSGNYTLVLADSGKHIYSLNTGAQVITIPTNASVAFPIGSLITFVNMGTSTITLSVTGVSVYRNGSKGVITSPTIPAGASLQLLKTDTNSWNTTFGNLALVFDASFLVIAGGGGGGYYDNAGGGGAGGMRTGTVSVSSGNSYAISVGAGGAGTPVGRGSSGGNSEVFSIISTGGGGGGGQGAADGLSGGSGGGGGTSGLGGSGTAGQGNSGASYNGGGGGAGAGGSGRNGGNGLASSITGTSVTRAGGGGAYPNGVGGTGGGGAGGFGAGTAGTANTGGGGGGGENTAGGSGVVIISSPIPAASTTGSPVVTTSGGNTIYQFNTSGTIIF